MSVSLHISVHGYHLATLVTVYYPMLMLGKCRCGNTMATPKAHKRVRVTLYLDRQEYEELRALSLKTGATQQWYLRQGLSRTLEQYQAKLPRP